MDYLKAKGETHLRPEMRRLILWGMASPLLSVVAAVFLVVIIRSNLYFESVVFGCFALLGSFVVVLWGFKEYPDAKKEPREFLNLYITMFALNLLLIAIYVEFTVLGAFIFAND